MKLVNGCVSYFCGNMNGFFVVWVCIVGKCYLFLRCCYRMVEKTDKEISDNI